VDKEKKIKELANKLANDQILRLKSRTSGRNVILQLAQDLTAEADRLVEPILDERMDLQFKLSNLNNVDIKVGGAVDVYDAENSKLKTCMSTRKASAIEQYDKELEDLQKQKKELMTSKTFEVQRNDNNPNQNNQDNKYKSYTDIPALQIEIARLDGVERRLAATKPQQGSQKDKDLKIVRRDLGQARERMNILRPKPKPGGGQRRVTMRQPRQPKRFHGY